MLDDFDHIIAVGVHEGFAEWCAAEFSADFGFGSSDVVEAALVEVGFPAFVFGEFDAVGVMGGDTGLDAEFIVDFFDEVVDFFVLSGAEEGIGGIAVVEVEGGVVLHDFLAEFTIALEFAEEVDSHFGAFIPDGFEGVEALILPGEDDEVEADLIAHAEELGGGGLVVVIEHGIGHGAGLVAPTADGV